MWALLLGKCFQDEEIVHPESLSQLFLPWLSLLLNDPLPRPNGNIVIFPIVR